MSGAGLVLYQALRKPVVRAPPSSAEFPAGQVAPYV
jgi:hypothetical protein